jgi:valyl-tRNA synthetase
MRGKVTLWLPGTDHASIATQNKVEKILLKDHGKTRHDLGRAKFLRQVNQYVKDSQHIIRRQVRKIGSSCDWSRERYTLDAGLTRAVQEVFARMYRDGLIYRGDRIVNWCPRCESTLADDEVEYKEKRGKLYHIKYLLKSKVKNQKSKTQIKSQKYIVVATTRPETMLGDTAVAVNPKDKRYKDLIGQKVILPLVGRELAIIADDFVDIKFGTGAVKVTPCHDRNDFEIGERHNLEKIKIFNNDARLSDQAPAPYQNLDRFKARKLIVADLKKQGLLQKIKDHKHSVGYCYRCDTVIEPLASKQWFIDVEKKLKVKSKKLKVVVGRNKASLKEIAIAVVKKNKIKIIPKRFNKIYFHWMNNLRDWCVSRQIWFGHRIPVWYCQGKIKNQKSKIKNQNVIQNSKFHKCSNVVVSITTPTKCPKCHSTKLKQDEDTLDTWFSSGLWTFSTLGWPKSVKSSNFKFQSYDKMNDLERFHPTSVMETGYDILFFWVARMILMSTYALGEVPFRTVYLHGLVRDKLGRKMSKSLGNGIDPIDMIKKYGADAVRLSLIIGTTPGNDIRLYEKKIAGYRNFVNKIWNIARYVISKSKIKNQKSKMPACHRPKAKPMAGRQIKNQKLTLSDKWILYELGELVKRVNRNLERYQFSRAGEDIYDFMWHKFADWYIEMTKKEQMPHQPAILRYVLEKCLVILHPFVPFVTEDIWFKFKTQNSKLKTTTQISNFLIVEPWVDNLDLKISKAQAQKFIKIQKEISKKRNIVKKKKQISKREIVELKNYIKSLEARLKNKQFLNSAPAAVITKEKERLAAAQAKLSRS